MLSRHRHHLPRSRALPTLITLSSMRPTAAAAPSGAVLQRHLPGVAHNLWRQQKVGPRRPALEGDDVDADVCIVGGGLAGLATAYRLVTAGRRVVVLESRACGAGMVGRSDGMASVWNTNMYSNVASIASKESVALVARSHQEAVQWLEETVKKEGIECDWERVEGYLVTHERSAKATRTLQQELDACRAAGVTGVELVDLAGPTALVTSGIGEALRFPGCGNADPLALVQGLAEAVERHGGVIYENSRAKAGLVAGPSGGVVQTLGGAAVRASQAVVLATRSPINRDQLAIHDRQLPQRFYLVALEVPGGSIKTAHLCDTGSVDGHSLHTARIVRGGGDSPQTDVLLVTGESHHHGSASMQPDPYGRLEAWARGRWPQAGRVLHRWTSMDYHPADLIGLYGKEPLDWSGNPPVYVITGYSRQELTGAVVGSEVVASSILGAPSRYTDIYRPGRAMPGAPLRYARELFTYFSSVAAGLGRWLPYTPSDVKGFLSPHWVEADLGPGQGTVVQHGWRKAALYKDEQGTVLVRSAMCTHLGCQVQYNPIDRCFDCPCHGSQYDVEGRCVNGPAVGDLEDLGGPRHSP